MALPFKQHNLFPQYHKKIMKHSQNKSAWSRKARTLNASLGTWLGTLVYLPLEIRQQIFRHVFESYYPGADGRYARVPETFNYLGRVTPTSDDPFSEDHPLDPTGGVFELDSYHVISEKAFDVNLRLASPTLRSEFEQFFLRSNVFEFSCHKRLGDFLAQLLNSHRKQPF